MNRCLACSQENCGYRSNCDCSCHPENKKVTPVNETTEPAKEPEMTDDQLRGHITKAFAYAGGDPPSAEDYAKEAANETHAEDGDEYHVCLDCEGEFADEDCHAVHEGFVCEGCFRKRGPTEEVRQEVYAERIAAGLSPAEAAGHAWPEHKGDEELLRRELADAVDPRLTAMNEAVAAAIDQRPVATSVATSVDSTGGTVAWRQKPPTAEEVRTQQWWWNKPTSGNPPHILQFDVFDGNVVELGLTSDCNSPFNADDWPGMWAPALPPENVVRGSMTMAIETIPENILDASDERTRQLGEQARQIARLNRDLKDADRATTYHQWWYESLQRTSGQLSNTVSQLQVEIREWQAEDRKKARRIRDLETLLRASATYITKHRPRQPTAKSKNFVALAEQLMAAADKGKKPKATTQPTAKKAPAKKKR